LTQTSAAGRPTLPKLATGIEGFDNFSRGGLPRGRTTLVLGGPGSGKTVFALQTLVNGARQQQPGIFVAFEESPGRLLANSAMFDWQLADLAGGALFLLDARMSPEVVQAGDFDLSGLLAMLQAKQREIGAQWIAFDGIDVLLARLPDAAAQMREIYRVAHWLAEAELTAIVTAKLEDSDPRSVDYGVMQYMVDCVVRFERRLEDAVLVHRVRITKYRGSDFAAGEFPVGFGTSGLEIGGAEPEEIIHAAFTERLSAGFERLDSMLGGGLFRGSSTLITGMPGTSKTTLTGRFAEAACLRGERVLFVSFDEAADLIMRNLSSVGIALKPHVQSGLLRMYSARTEAIGAEQHLNKLRALLRQHQPSCMVIDPMTAIAKAGGLGVARAVVNRLIYLIKDTRVTLMLTALCSGDDPQSETTELQISTIADTWIHLSYMVRSGERNRALTIVKSRGTWHSNQVRELVLSAAGMTLADVYTAGGEVLMGTLRWEKEVEERAKRIQRHAEFDHRRRALQSAEATTAAQIAALQMELQRQQAELALYAHDNEVHNLLSSDREQRLREMRSADGQHEEGGAPAPPPRRAGVGSVKKAGNGGAK
jgi:circadian clock protein KaiC